MKADVITLSLLNTLSPCLFYLLKMITHDTVLRKLLGNIRSA